MRQRKWPVYAGWILFTEAVGALSGFLSRDGTRIYTETIVRPPLSPPSIVFPIVWVILFALMGFGAARVFLQPASAQRTLALRLFFIQLGFNFFWSIIFFELQNFAFALLWLAALWLLILWMIAAFRRVDPLAGWLQIPSLLWVTFAAYLNLGVCLLN